MSGVRKRIFLLFIFNLGLFACSRLHTATSPDLAATITGGIQEIPTETSSPTVTHTLTSTNLPTAIDTPSPTEIATKIAPTGTPTPRDLPEPCGVVEFGIPGTQTRDHTEAILIEGTAILCADVYLWANAFWHISAPEGHLDLDTGQTGISSKADIEFYAAGGTDMFYYIYSTDGAITIPWSISLVDGEYVNPPQPSFEDCIYEVSTYANDNEPQYVCVITDIGNVARIKLERYDPLGSAELAIEISFITWTQE